MQADSLARDLDCVSIDDTGLAGDLGRDRYGKQGQNDENGERYR